MPIHAFRVDLMLDRMLMQIHRFQYAGDPPNERVASG